MNDRSSTDIARVMLVILVIGLLIMGSLWVLRPFLPALIWATMIVVATWPILISIQRHLWNKRALAVVAMMLIMLVIIILPIFAAVATLIMHADTLTQWAKLLQGHGLPVPPSWVHSIPFVGERVASEWQGLVDAGPTGMLQRIEPYAATIGHWLIGQAGTLGMLMVHLVLTVIISGLLYARGEVAGVAITRFARRLAPTRGSESVMLAGSAVRAVALGIVVTALVQSALGGLGLWVAGVPFAGILTAIMLLLCIAQLGPALPLTGGIIWLYWQDHATWGTILLVWSIMVVMLDNVLRPMLIKRGANLPLLLILIGVLGGMLAFGIVGLFVGPAILAVTHTLMSAWVAETVPPVAGEQASTWVSRDGESSGE